MPPEAYGPLTAEPIERSAGPAHIDVLYSVPRPSKRSNPYTTLLADAVAEAGCDVRFFSWRTALIGTYDLVHVHWPETLVRSDRRIRRTARLIAGYAGLLRWWVTRTPVVWTVHNRAPHESGTAMERHFVRQFVRLVSHRIYLNRSLPMEKPSDVILHGTYEPWYGPLVNNAQKDRGRILFFGMIRPYKGVESLFRAFETARNESETTLRVVGEPTDVAFAATLSERMRAVPGVTFDLRRVDDDVLAQEVSGAGVVALPYREMYNSGALILALSLGTHVLAPKTPANETLLEEFGDRWLTLFDGELSASDLRTAVAAAQANAVGDRPRMSGRQWQDAAVEHARVYSSLAKTRRSRRGRQR